LQKQYKMLSTCLKYYYGSKEALARGVQFDDIADMKIREEIARMKYLPEKDISKIDTLQEKIEGEFKKLIAGQGKAREEDKDDKAGESNSAKTEKGNKADVEEKTAVNGGEQ
jgi:hypothetical protein